MNRIARKNARTIGEVLKLFFKENHLSASHNARRIYEAWNVASGAGAYTIKRYFRDGKLYITLSSSVVCTRLSMQKDLLVEKINAILDRDELFIRDDERLGNVRELILR